MNKDYLPNCLFCGENRNIFTTNGHNISTMEHINNTKLVLVEGEYYLHCKDKDLYIWTIYCPFCGKKLDKSNIKENK